MMMVNTELECINEWIKLNKLSLNITKTSYMVISATTRKCDSNDCKIMIDGQSIKRVNYTQFLGFIIDDKLTWSQHVSHICNTVSKGMGILLRARKFMYGQTLITLHSALIKPHFMYCITILGNTFKKYLNKVHLIQKKVIRIITFSEFNAPTAPLLDKLDILNIYQIVDYFVGLFVYKSLQEMMAGYLSIFQRNFNT
jgi:hypothetical protein